MDKKKIIVMIIFILVGLGLSIFSFMNIKKYNEKDKTYIETTAKVVDYEYDRDEEGRELAAIISEYKVERNTYRIKSSSFSSNPKAIGSIVKIKYNPNNPSEAIYSGDKSYYFVLGVGVLFTLVGLFVTFKEIKDNN